MKRKGKSSFPTKNNKKRKEDAAANTYSIAGLLQGRLEAPPPPLEEVKKKKANRNNAPIDTTQQTLDGTSYEEHERKKRRQQKKEIVEVLHDEIIEPSLYDVPAEVLRNQKLPSLRPRAPLLELFPAGASTDVEMMVSQVLSHEWELWVMGVTKVFRETGHSYSSIVRISDFCPSFLINVPPDCPPLEVLKQAVNRKAGSRNRIVRMTMERRTVMVGYTNYKQEDAIRVTCSSVGAFGQFAKLFKTKTIEVVGYGEFKFTTYHTNFKPHNQFLNELGLALGGWIKVFGKLLSRGSSERKTTCQFEYVCGWRQLRTIVDQAIINAITDDGRLLPRRWFVSFDIETVSALAAQHFGNAKNRGDMCMTIGLVFYREYDEGPFVTVVQQMGYTHPVAGAITLSYNSEAQLLHDFQRMICELGDVDAILGWKSMDFDAVYITQRCNTLGLPRAGRLSRFKDYECRIDKRMKFTKQNGAEEYEFVSIPGRVQFDVLKIERRKLKLRSYTLKAVSEYVLAQDKKARPVEEKKVEAPENAEDLANVLQTMAAASESPWMSATAENSKIDLPYRFLRPYFLEGPHHRSLIAQYCARDAVLPLKIAIKQQLIVEYSELSYLSYTDMETLITGGQQCRVFNRIINMIYVDPPRWLINDELLDQFRPKEEEREACDASHARGQKDLDEIEKKVAKYQGATVLDAKAVYRDELVITLDFSSLYPSIIQAHNCDYSSWLNDQKSEQAAQTSGVAIDEIACGDRKARFVQTQNGILPRILTFLLAARKRAKEQYKDAKKAGDKFLMSVYDAKQAALKILCNSCYGFTGAKEGFLPLPVIAEAVCAWGRQMLMIVKEIVENEFGGEVIYGDSVSADTSMVVREAHTGEIRVCRVDDLICDESHWQPYGEQSEKEAAFLLAPTEVWSDGGFTIIRRVIRHRHNGVLKRVLTHTGVVDVTNDHSLLKADGSVIKPSDVKIGDHLLHQGTNELTEMLSRVQTQCLPRNEEEAWTWGLFMAEGSCDTYGSGANIKRRWKISNQDTQLLERAQRALPFTTKISDHTVSSRVYNLVLIGPHTAVVNGYRSLFYNSHKEKRVPMCILHAPMQMAQAFFDGFCAGDGGINQRRSLRFDQTGKESCTGLWLLAQRLGWDGSVHARENNPCMFRINLSSKEDGRGFCRKRDLTAVKKIWDLVPGDGKVRFVYDLETENHHFGVGPGELVVHNTDSVMIVCGTATKKVPRGHPDYEANKEQRLIEAFELAPRIAKHCTARFKTPISLEFEKVFNGYLQVCPKKYGGLCVKSLDCPGELMIKGMESERRDFAEFTSNMVRDMLEMIILRGDIQGAVDLVQRTANDLIADRIPQEKMLMSKQLKYEYKTAGKLIQVRVNEKMAERNPADRVPAGERISWLVCNNGQKDFADRGEPIAHVRENKIPVDVEWYFSVQLMAPAKRLLDVVISNADEVFKQYYPFIYQKMTHTNAVNELFGADISEVRRIIGKCKS